MMPLQTVHIRVNDAATGQPTPVRLRITDSDGNYFAPFGHAAEFPTGRDEAVGGDVILDGRRWAYIDGSCEIALPPGPLIVEGRKGPEFRPIRESVYLPAGKMALRFPIERWADRRADGWMCGDPRVHALWPHAALLEAASEDLDVVHILATATPMHASDGRTYITVPNLEAFSDQQAALERDGRLVAVGTHNVHPVLGSLALLHCHRVVYPLTFGGPDATDDWSLGDWCDQCHRKSGLVIWTDAGTTPIGQSAEALAHAILGHVDAVEITPDHPDGLTLWQQLLAAGVRIPIVGASGKRSNAVATGAGRTYAHADPAHGDRLRGWIEALRAGKTVASFGARIRLAVNDSGPGDTLRLTKPAALRPHADVIAVEPTTCEIVWNGQVLPADADLRAESSGWLSARAWNAGRTRLVAQTSPVWIELAGVPQPRSAGALAALRRHLDAGRDWVERVGRFEKTRSRELLLETFSAASAKLVG